jgi:hypothetical protein
MVVVHASTALSYRLAVQVSFKSMDLGRVASFYYDCKQCSVGVVIC